MTGGCSCTLGSFGIAGVIDSSDAKFLLALCDVGELPISEGSKVDVVSAGLEPSIYPLGTKVGLVS